MTSLIPKLKQPRELLNHIPDEPKLPAIIQSLEAGTLSKLIRHVGLEDSTQIISLTPADQLKCVHDEDLWYSESPGREETFDVERFSLWLEIMMENGSTFAARKIMELDEDLVTLGLCRLVWVVGGHDPALHLDKALNSSLNH